MCVNCASLPCVQRLHITHVVNVSVECERSPYVAEENFLRVPLTDKQTEKILPHFQDAFAFIGTLSSPFEIHLDVVNL